MIYVIAKCVDTENRLVGYRLYESTSGNVVDATLNSIVTQIENGVKIDNTELTNGKVTITHGDQSRYGVIKCGVLLSKNPAVILKEYLDKSYDVITASGQKIRMTYNSLLLYIRTEGISNCSVVGDGINNAYIRGIGHEIEREIPVNIDEISEILRIQSEMFETDYRINELNEFVLTNLKKEKIFIPHSAFQIAPYGCAKSVMTDVIFGKQVKRVGTGAFFNCTKLKKVKLNNGLQFIEDNAFANTAVTTIELPASVLKVGNGAFPKCKKLIINNRRTELKPAAVPSTCRKVYN